MAKKYYTYRLKEEPEKKDKILLQDVPIILKDSDMFLVFIAGSLEVLGIYKKEDDHLILDKKIDDKKLSDFYEYFNMISFVNERTYKMFAKRIREIEEQDMERIIGSVNFSD